MLPKTFKFSPILTIAAIMLAAVMLWASKWQWRRYHEKVALVESYSTQSKVAALPYPDSGSPFERSAVIGKKVSLKGEFDFERQMIVINRESAAGPGFWLLAPFKVYDSAVTDSGAKIAPGRSEPKAVIVSRGFIPFEDDTPEKWRKYDLVDQLQSGAIEIQGVAQPSVAQRFSFGPSNPETGPNLPFKTRWLFPEIEKIAKQLPYSVATELYIQKLGGGPLNGFPAEDVRIEVPPSTHFGYTIEWIFLAIATLTISFLIQAFPQTFRRRATRPIVASEQLRDGLAAAILATTLLLYSPTYAAATTKPEKVQEQAQINERFGETVDLDLELTDASGAKVKLRDMMVPNRPLVLVPVYFHCPNLCGLLQGGVVDAINRTDLMLGTDYSVVSFSIDTEESSSNAAARRDEFTARLTSASERSVKSWHFATGDKDNITKLVRQIGFRYATDDQEFIHSAILVVLAPDGKISRYLYGIRFEPKDFKMALLEGASGKIGTFVDRILMFCFHFDDNTGKYTLAIMNLVRIISFAIVLALVGSIIYLKKCDKRGL
jgi:protein SCO1/2